jgi:hypothetical protein
MSILLKNIPERGVAGLKLDLKNSVITMRHSHTNEVLVQFNATMGDWSSICDHIRSVAEGDSI